MSLVQTIILAIVQGLTEFLPISSSAHLAVIPKLFGWPDPGLSFDIALHFGTLISILLYFWRDWVQVVGQAFGLNIGIDDQLKRNLTLLSKRFSHSTSCSVPEPVVSTAGTLCAPVSGTLKEVASARAAPAFTKPRRTTKGRRTRRRFKAFIFSSIRPASNLSQQIVGIELRASSHNLSPV